MRNPCTTIMTFQPQAADFHQALVLIYWAVLTISRLFTLPYFLFHKIVVITHLPGLICLGSSLVLDSEHLQPRWPPVEQSAPYISMILRKNKGLQTGALWTLLIVQLLAGSFLKKKNSVRLNWLGSLWYYLDETVDVVRSVLYEVAMGLIMFCSCVMFSCGSSYSWAN